jgi:hypothetical protein
MNRLDHGVIAGTPSPTCLTSELRQDSPRMLSHQTQLMFAINRRLQVSQQKFRLRPNLPDVPFERASGVPSATMVAPCPTQTFTKPVSGT